MAKAGMEKLASHAEEHLPGGLYYHPTAEMEEAARTIGEATNDRIESMFGQLDRYLFFYNNEFQSFLSAAQTKMKYFSIS